jgi:regulatory protein
MHRKTAITKDAGTKSAAAAKAQRKKPKPITATRLEASAVFYLQRYAASRQMVQDMLERKIYRAAQEPTFDTDVNAAREWARQVIDKLTRLGYIDDTAYTRTKVRSLLRQGASRRKISQYLYQKGIDTEQYKAVIEDVQSEFLIENQNIKTDSECIDLDTSGADLDIDWMAAVKYAKRRRLGPFRIKDREERRQKDAAALARQGFAADIVWRLIDADAATLDGL